MCLVELNNLLVPSCAINLNNNMIIFTKNKRINLARESILEFLLVNHPLDCPICDQGGECDLQDITLTYGSDKGRFYELFKRSVPNLNCCGPLIKTIMTRCIHCTRCIRFVNEISGNFNLGIIGRGNNMEIGTYIKNHINDELIGNIIDICPVGALTSMPFSFTTRAWKLISIRTIDILDSIASSIRIDILNNKIMRILPSLDGSINEEWITNKIRFSYDSLNVQRLLFPKVLFNNKFIIISWNIALYFYINIIYIYRLNYLQIICGPFFDIESCISLKKFFNSFGCSNINYFENNNYLSFILDFRILYLLNKTLINLENLNNIIFIGSNIRMELPLLNIRIRKNYIENNNLNIISFGLSIDFLTYPIINLGNSMKTIITFLEGKIYYNFIIFFFDFLNINFFNLNYINKIYFFLGMSILNRIDNDSILYGFLNLLIILKFNNFEYLNIIPKFLGRISCFEIGILNSIKSNFLDKNLYKLTINHYCGVDIDINKIYFLDSKNINIYQGPFYINNFFKYIFLILPTTVFTESYYSYLNLEGRYRLTKKAISLKSKIYNDSKIFQILLIVKNNILKNNFSIITNFYKFVNYFKNIINYYYFNEIIIKPLLILDLIFFKLNLIILFFSYKIINSLILRTVQNIFLTDPITKNSKIMNICSTKLKLLNFSNKN
jgi:NADH dehydrogenase/NADH:ubiquinone oxidoreductase subunit G